MSPLHTYCPPPPPVVVYLLEIGPLTPSGNQKALTPLNTPPPMHLGAVWSLPFVVKAFALGLASLRSRGV